MGDNAIVSAPPALLDTCLQIVKTLHGVQQWMKPAPLTMTSLANECLGLHEMLAQGRDRMDAAQNNQPQLVKTMEGFLLGCSMTVSVVDEYAMELHEAVTLIVSTITDRALKDDIRLLWKEEDMKELLSQTRGYQNRLRSLLDGLDKIDTLRQTSERNLGNQSALINLLNRSHSSFQIRPNSIRSSLRDSFISLDPSPPYALSLNGDATEAVKRIAEDLSLYLSDIDTVARVHRSPSSLSDENIPKEIAASNEDDGLHEHDEPNNPRTRKSNPTPALAEATEKLEDDDMYRPMLAGSSGTNIRDAERGTSLTKSSSYMRARVASGAQTVASLTRSQPATQLAEAAVPIAKAGSMILYTIAIAGSEDSGKTELMNWFLHRGIDQEVISSNNNTRLCKIDDANVVIDIIDNSGQEYYESTRYNYLSRAEGYILVYNASSYKSFNALQHLQSEVSRLREDRVRGCLLKRPTLLVAHNVESEAERQVSHAEGRSFANESGCTLVDVDRKDYSSVEAAIYDVIRLIRKQYTQYTPETDRDTRSMPYLDPAVAKMIKAHSVFRRDERSLAWKTLGDIWKRRRG